MGNCAGCCISHSDNSCGICGFTVPRRRRDSFDFSFLVDEVSSLWFAAVHCIVITLFNCRIQHGIVINSKWIFYCYFAIKHLMIFMVIKVIDSMIITLFTFKSMYIDNNYIICLYTAGWQTVNSRKKYYEHLMLNFKKGYNRRFNHQ